MEKFKKDGTAMLTVSFWVVRMIAGILAISAETQNCTIKNVTLSIGTIIGFFVVAQVIWEVHSLVRSNQVDSKKTK